MPVWPPQNTGIFDFKIPGGGPQAGAQDATTPLSGGFWLRPVTPYVADNTGPHIGSWTTPTLAFTPVGAQGSSLTLISAATIFSGSTVTQLGPFSFTVTLTLTIVGLGPIFDQLLVKYSDEDGNIGYGVVPIGSVFTNGLVSVNHVTGMPASFAASSVAPATATSNSATIATPVPGPPFFFLGNWIVDGLQVSGIELNPSSWMMDFYPSGNVAGNPTNVVYVDSQFFAPNTPYFEQKIYGLIMMLGTAQHLTVTEFFYTDIVPVIFTISGKPYSK